MAKAKAEEKEQTISRAFALPIHSIEPMVATDQKGWELLRCCWQHGTMLANWAVTQMVKIDIPRLPGMEQLPPAPEYDLYARAFGRKKQLPRCGKKADQPLASLRSPEFDGGDFFTGAQISAQDILQTVEKKYNQERLDVVWRRAKSPCTYRYPMPWPVHASQWKGAGYTEAGKPYIIVTLPGGTVKITMRGGAEFGRQLSHFKDVVKEFEDAKKEKRKPKVRQLQLYQQGSSSSCHRPTMSGEGRPARAMCKMVYTAPIPEHDFDRVLVLATDPNCFWVAELDGQPAWKLNGDMIKRVLGHLAFHDRHMACLQRISEDSKFETRTTARPNPLWPKQQLRKWQAMDEADRVSAGQNRNRRVKRRLEAMAEKDKRRLQSWTHESTAHLVGYCIKQRVGVVLYLDRDKGFIEKFPWFQLHQKLADKLKASGIAFYSESRDGNTPDPEAEESSEGVVDIEGGNDKWLRATRLREMAGRKVAKARSRKGSHPAVSAVPGT